MIYSRFFRFGGLRVRIPLEFGFACWAIGPAVGGKLEVDPRPCSERDLQGVLRDAASEMFKRVTE